MACSTEIVAGSGLDLRSLLSFNRRTSWEAGEHLVDEVLVTSRRPAHSLEAQISELFTGDCMPPVLDRKLIAGCRWTRQRAFEHVSSLTDLVDMHQT